MTSKEALEQSKYILKNLKTRSIEWEQEAADFHERVIKDLEVLELLRKHCRVCFDDETENGLDDTVFNGVDLDDIWGYGYDEDFEKIMEWLKNEK